MRLDVLDLITPDANWRKSNGLYMKDHTMYTYLDAQQLVYIKGEKGYPWDWYTFNGDFINLLLTEKDWSNPKTGKIQYKDGAPRYPRYIDYSPDQQGQAIKSFSLSQPRTDYLILNADGSCQCSSNGAVICSFYGPIPGSAILDSKGNTLIPAGVDWVSDYKRSGALERLKHRVDNSGFRWGRISWEQYDNSGALTGSSYTTGITVAPCPNPVQQLW